MTIDSIEDVIRKIKEKANKIPKYLHPMNKDLQEDAKMFGFSSTGRYIIWLQQNGILKNPTDVHREIRNMQTKMHKEQDLKTIMKDKENIDIEQGSNFQ